MHDTPSKSSADLIRLRPRLEHLVLQACSEPLPTTQPASASRRGRPLLLPALHLWLALLISMLSGMQNYQDLWRTLRSRSIGPFQPIALTDDAVVKRLRQAGIEPLSVLFTRISQLVATFLSPLPPALPVSLAAFASKIVAIDETTWDAVRRQLCHLRHVPAGDPALSPGKLAARFDVRLQQWEWLQFRSSAQANCKVEICSFLQGLPIWSLLLFDLGYFSFPWFDSLTQMHSWFITRSRQKTSYQIVHTFYRHEGILDALVWMGTSHRAHTGHLLRLVRYFDGTDLRMYVTNVLDPRQLSLPDIARLYARRGDIELAFLTLKEHLNLHHWWSAHTLLMQQQVLIVLIVAQLLQAMRMQIAFEASIDPFEVSLPLLARALPQFLRHREDLVEWVLRSGKDTGFIRPSSRIVLRLPEISCDALSFPLTPLKLTRPARYVEYVPTPKKSSRPKKKSLNISNPSP
ncbi:MAG: transposase [Ktedonobacteraceae bacterium]